MARAGGSSWNTGPGGRAIEVPDADLIAHGTPVRVGDSLVLVGPDGARFVVEDYYRMDPPPVLVAGSHRLPPEGIQLAAAGTVLDDGQQLAAAGDAKPRTVSAKAVEDFTNSLAQGKDFGTAVDELAATQVRQAIARGVPPDVAKKAAAAFANELALNLGNRMGVDAAIADAERSFAGAVKALSVTDKADPLLQALTTGKGLDDALAGAGVSGKRGAQALGDSLNAGEQHGRAAGKGHSADLAHDKAAKSGNALMDALVSGEGADKVADVLKDPVAAQRFAEMLQQGMSPDRALGAARQAAEAAAQAKSAADAASKGGMEALASGKGGDAQLADALRQNGIDGGGQGHPQGGKGGGNSLMEALASGQGIAQMIGGGGGKAEQAFGNALAEGRSVEQANAAAQTATSASGKVAADSTLGQIASGNASSVSGSSTFERALSEALSQGASTGTAITEASQRAAAAAQANQKVEAANAFAGGSPNPFGSSPSPFVSSPVTASPPPPATQTASQPTATAQVASFVSSMTQATQSQVSQSIASMLNALQAQVSTNTTSNTTTIVQQPPPDTSRNDTPPRPNAPPTVSLSAATVAEDGTVTLSYSASDSDGQIASVSVSAANGVLLPVNAVVVNQANSTITLNPAANKYGSSALTIQVTDNSGASATASATVTVTPVGDTATVESKTTNEDTTVTLRLTRAAVDTAEGADVSHFRITGITGGTLTTMAGAAVAEGGYVAIDPATGYVDVKYTPGANLNSTDLTRVHDFHFDVQGAVGTTGTGLSPVKATSTITVTSVNDAPTAADKSVDVARATYALKASDFSFSDVDTGDTLKEVVLTGFTGNGTLLHNNGAITYGTGYVVSVADLDAGKLTYVPNNAGNDLGSLTFKVRDGLQAESGVQTITLSDAPLAVYGYTQSAFGYRTSTTLTNDLDVNSGITSQSSFSFGGVYGPVQAATLKITAYNVNYTLGERDQIRFNNSTLGNLQGSLLQTSNTNFSVTNLVSSSTNTVNVKVYSYSGSSLFGDNYLSHTANLDLAQLTVTYKTLAGAKVNAFDLMGSTVTGGNVMVDSRAILGITTAGDYRVEFRVVNSAGAVVATKAVDILGAGANSTQVVTASPYFANSTAGGTYEVQAALMQLSGGNVVAASGQTIATRSFTHVQNGAAGADISNSLATLAANTATGSTIALLGASDTNPNQTITYSLVSNPGNQFALGTNADGLTELRVGGALTMGAQTVTVRATDATGLYVDKTFTVTVGAANAAPTFQQATTATQTVAEDGSVTFAVAATDTDTLTYTASAKYGTATVDANGSVTYTPNAEYNGADVVTVTASDGFVGNTITRAVDVTVTAVNDRPDVGGDASYSATSKVSDLLAGLASDVDGDAVGIAVWDSAGIGTWQYSLDNGATWSALGATQSSAARLLSADAYVRFTTLSTAAVTPKLSFVGWDGTAGGSSGDTADIAQTTAFGTTTRSILTNTAPVINTASQSLAAFNEDSPAGTGTLVSTLVANVTDADSGAQKGMAITGIGSGTGWEYSLDNGTTWTTMGTVSGSSALHLLSTDLVRFNTPADWNGTADFTWRAWDQTNTIDHGTKANIAANGVISPYSNTIGTVSQVVNAVNDAPVNTIPTARTVNEDTALVFSTGNGNAITVADVDSTSLTTTISVGAGKGTLTVATGSGATITNDGTDTVTIAGTAAQIDAALNGLSYLAPTNANGSNYASLSISTTDGALTDTDTVAITVTAVNDAPTIPATDTAMAFTTTGLMAGETVKYNGQWVENIFAANSLSGSYFRMEMDVYLLADGQQHNLARLGEQVANQGDGNRMVPTVQSDSDAGLWSNQTGDLIPAGSPKLTADGAWHTLRFTYDANAATGQKATMDIGVNHYVLGDPSTFSTAGNMQLWVGSDQGLFASKSVIDNVKLYSAANTLMSEWRFSEGSGTTVADASGNGHTGTLGSTDTTKPSFVTVYNNNPFTVENNATKAFTLPGFDVDGDTLTYTINSITGVNNDGGGTAAHGSVIGSVTNGGVMTYQAGNTAGQDQISYTITDGHGGSVTNVVNLAVV